MNLPKNISHIQNSCDIQTQASKNSFSNFTIIVLMVQK